MPPQTPTTPQQPNVQGPSLNDPLPPVLPQQQPREKHSVVRSFFSTLILIIGALLFALTINAFVFQSYEVDGSSMEPTLQNKDRLIIWKLPRTWSMVTHHGYLPKRGDVIVFHKPDGSDEQLIKRVIGLPGERVVVNDGKITVFNNEFPNGFNPDDAEYGENLAITSGNVDVKVGVDEIFVSGDNRIPGASLDSRSSLGNVPLEKVVGKLVLRLFPLQNSKVF